MIGDYKKVIIVLLVAVCSFLTGLYVESRKHDTYAESYGRTVLASEATAKSASLDVDISDPKKAQQFAAGYLWAKNSPNTTAKEVDMITDIDPMFKQGAYLYMETKR
jgi:hypothetical protein